MIIDFPDIRTRFASVDGGEQEGAILYINFYTHSIDLASKHIGESGRYLLPLSCDFNVMPQAVNNWLIREKNNLRALLEKFTFRNNGEEHILCMGAISEVEDANITIEFRKEYKKLQRSFKRMGGNPENLWVDMAADEFLKPSYFEFNENKIRQKGTSKEYEETELVQLAKQVEKKAAQTGMFLHGTYSFISSLFDAEI